MRINAWGTRQATGLGRSGFIRLSLTLTAVLLPTIYRRSEPMANARSHIRDESTIETLNPANDLRRSEAVLGSDMAMLSWGAISLGLFSSGDRAPVVTMNGLHTFWRSFALSRRVLYPTRRLFLCRN